MDVIKGRLVILEGCDVAAFLLAGNAHEGGEWDTGGAIPAEGLDPPVSEIFQVCRKDLKLGSKADNTLGTEAIDWKQLVWIVVPDEAACFRA